MGLGRCGATGGGSIVPISFAKIGKTKGKEEEKEEKEKTKEKKGRNERERRRKREEEECGGRVSLYLIHTQDGDHSPHSFAPLSKYPGAAPVYNYIYRNCR